MADTGLAEHADPAGTAPAARGRIAAAIVVPALVACLLAVLRHPRVVYTSDSTAQQSIVRTWLDVGHGTTHLPADTWLFKFPLYLVLEAIGLSPVTKLLIAVLVLTALTFVLLGAGVLLLAPRARWYQLAAPLVFLAAMGGGIGSNRNLPNYRNVELGLCFLLLALAARYLARRRPPVSTVRTLLLAAAVSLGLAVFWFDDPYFEMLVGLPLMLLAPAWYLLRTRDPRLLHLAGCLLGSFLLLPLLQQAVGVVGLEIDHTKQLSPSLSAATHGWGQLLHDTATQFGVERWHGTTPLVITSNLLMLGVFALFVAGSAVGAARFWRSRELVPFTIVATWPLCFLGTVVQDDHPTRYLILAPYQLAVTAVLLLPGLPERWPARPALVVLSCAALVTGASGATIAIRANAHPSTALTTQDELIDAVRATGPAKGLAPYWFGNVSSYLAGGERTVYELECDHGVLQTRSWLSDTARLTRKASSTFLIWSPDYYGSHGCDTADRDRILGDAVRVRSLSDGTQILEYGYDISGRLP
ncbi:hypothetical protein KIH74_26840 [Kineosporia sp. J2-2]|uniref:Dolichyl-phosphate-mannose-protein mannosyltransferase n=1 Tax=Kineosporia corallincola TaxID=2835133 RepID=A0ABS5TQF3_9ACTN|nr:hypothetical protein [Kineosporia corallincola]MBT0772589.1 hypothetical protein [Kineosporia corallincola]